MHEVSIMVNSKESTKEVNHVIEQRHIPYMSSDTVQPVSPTGNNRLNVGKSIIIVINSSQILGLPIMRIQQQEILPYDKISR
jgi:hypothetical protein